MKNNGVGKDGVRRPLELELLEERIAPAGVIHVQVLGGTLVVTGDEGSNVAVIDQYLLEPDEFRITVGDDTLVVIGNGKSATGMIDDEGPGADEFGIPAEGETMRMPVVSAVIPGVTRGIRLEMGDGDDYLHCGNITVAGPVVFDGGSGGNTFIMEHSTINNAVTVKSGDGLALTLTDTTITGSLSVLSGDAPDTISIGSLVVGNAITLKLGDGDSNVSMISASSIGSTKITTGDGNDTIILSFIDTGSDELNKRGDLSLALGDGDTNLHICANTYGNLKISAGKGTDTLRAESTKVSGNMSILNGNGDSITNIEEVEVLGSISVVNGLGSDDMIADDMNVTGGWSVKNGAGDSRTRFYTTTIGGALSVKNGDGDNTTIIQGVTVTKATTLAGTDGLDAITASGATLRGGLTIKTGDGGSDIDMASTYIGCDESFTGRFYGLNVQAGDGDNILSTLVTVGKNTAIKNAGTTSMALCGVFGGNISVKTTGDAAATIDVQSVELNGKLSIYTGGGDDTIEIDDLFAGSLSVKTNAGNDVLNIETTGGVGGVRSEIEGGVTLSMGNGDDTVVLGVGGLEYNSIYVGAVLRADGGKGSDTFYGSAASEFAAAPVVRNFEI